MQVFEAAEKEPRSVPASGVFNGRRVGLRVGLEVAVTNTSRPDGNATPWAYYNFRDPSLLVGVRSHRHAADGAGGQARFSNVS
jgi:hypothetical protein